MTKDEMERQTALGYGWGKRMPNPLSYNGIIRWLDNGMIVEFTKPVFNASDTNVEFEINNNPNHKVWLSQLQGVFMNDDNRGELYCGLMTLKDGTENVIRELSSLEFWDIVKDRKFRVSIDNNARLLIDERNTQVRALSNYFKVVDYIFEKLDTK